MTHTKRQIAIVLMHAFIGWILCGAVMGVGMQVTTLENTLMIHAIAAPVFFGFISLFYFVKFKYTTPLQTAIIFLAFVLFMDVFIVSLWVQKSFEMFESVLGTWLPLALIFGSTWVTGLYTRNKSGRT